MTASTTSHAGGFTPVSCTCGDSTTSCAGTSWVTYGFDDVTFSDPATPTTISNGPVGASGGFSATKLLVVSEAQAATLYADTCTSGCPTPVANSVTGNAAIVSSGTCLWRTDGKGLEIYSAYLSSISATGTPTFTVQCHGFDGTIKTAYGYTTSSITRTRTSRGYV
ncbi:hypothetical protein HYH03_013565 [Edaphochlamys debaryana]|uniref:Uncharacterized protein n=1 Tax=Edaphochlamys debaryana TaxID=47281 RepID=A0A835XPJ1_9CHLO|nr:hypothetical protein HYH03_013565 [Edaphochlamys debaryana]|eukprot:KAG2487848.1 hypothetical protein HYH03_013565 [Edaphochlamys debaryana]